MDNHSKLNLYTNAWSSQHSMKSIVNTFEFLGKHRKKENVSQDENERIRTTREVIPLGVKSILDVGCGDGRIIEKLGSTYKKVGVDYAFSSISQVKTPRVQGSSGSLPFRDRSFDLVLCCEVLEHLDELLFKQTIKELIRVSRQYVLISVPYKENLRQSLTRCPECHCVFHIWGHCRSFSGVKLDRLFVPLQPVSTRFSGSRVPYFNSMVLWLNQTYGNRWADFERTTICPECGNTKFKQTGRNAVTVLCGLAHMVTSKLPLSTKTWIIKIYSHNGE